MILLRPHSFPVKLMLEPYESGLLIQYALSFSLSFTMCSVNISYMLLELLFLLFLTLKETLNKLHVPIL